LFLVLSVVVLVLVNGSMKRLALMDAEHAARMLLDHNLAIHTYFTQDLKPKLFERLGPISSKDYFDPVWMSSTYAVRKMDQYFRHINQSPYYYKECAINARSPDNEADTCEQEFLTDLQSNPELTTSAAIRVLDGKPYFTLLRRGETMEESCLRCHSTPENAPGDMVRQYGPKRSFNRKVDEVAQAISIRIPLSDAFSSSTQFAYYLSGLLLVALGGGFLLAWIGNQRLLIGPLARIQDQATRIASEPERLGETIPEPQVRELRDLVAAFNRMSVELRKISDQQEQRIVERTRDLSQTNELLTQEINDRKQAEAALGETAARLRFAQDAAKAGSWEWDLETGENYWSDELWALYGLKPQSCRPSYETWLQTIHPDDRAEIARTVQEAASKGIELNAEWRTDSGEAGQRWLMSRGRPVCDASGRVVRYIGIVMDITDRKRAEELIHDSEKNHRLLIENLQAGVVVHAPDTSIVFCNSVAAALFGLDPAKMKGKTPSDLHWSFFREDGSPMPENEYAVNRVARTLEPLTNHVVGRLDPKTGDRVWGLVNAYPALNANKELEQIVVTFLDITDRKRAEENLRQSETRYRRLHESMRDAFVQVDMSGLIVDFNTAYQDMLGYEPEELRRLTYPELTPPQWHAFEARIVSEDIVPFGRSAVYEKQYIRKDGTVFPVELRTSLITDDEGNPTGMWAIVRDITDRKRAEVALRESEKKFRLLYEEAPVPYQSLDEDGNLLEVNAAWLSLLGYARHEVIGKRFADFLSPRVRERFKETFGAFKRDGYVKGVEQEIVRKDQSIIDVSIDGRIAKSEEGVFKHTHCVFQDITQRKRAEQALLESEQRYRAIFNTALVGIDLLDSQARYLEVNATLCHFLGYSSEELRNLSFLDVTHPDDVIRSRELYMSLVQGNRENYRLEKRYVRKDGATVWADLASSVIRDADGEFRAVVGVVRDITQYKASEEARIRLEAAVEHAAETVEITDAQATIVYVNPSFERTTGYTREEAVGTNPRILQSGHHDKAFYQDMWRTIGSGKIWRGRLINKKKDGTLFEEDVSISPIRNDSGEIVNYVAVKRDVTKEVSLQEQLLQAQKMEAIGTLAGGIAHDFNNILQVGLGYSELLLEDEELPALFRSDLKKIHESSRRGADLVQRLLTFSRKTEIKPQPLNLNRRITEIRKMLERTIPKMIDIRLNLGENLATVSADPTQIDQLLMNLVVNARDAMPEGGQLVIATANVFLDEDYAKGHLGTDSGHHILLTVTDTGSGMDKETVQHIFEPFYTTKAVGEGTGLGLAMVHGIVRQHNGHIRCYSEPGQGTTFKILLPALVSNGDAEPVKIAAMPQGGTETVLLVDDEEPIRDLGARILTRAGYTVITAFNGKEALDRYRERAHEIALVVLDLIMPEMGGKQCLEVLLSLDPSLKVVIASGYSAIGPAQDALSAGAKGFIDKPYDIRQMLQVVRKVLDGE
jgi:two-component system, cell cycle sensor histidine kinase and response regulator CckA